jgi:hypothetical protein
MTVWVMRDGKLVNKATVEAAAADFRSIFPTPYVSPALSYESPVTGREITSWRARDADMKAAGACDPRDLPRKPFDDRKKANAILRDKPAEWGGPTRH